MPRSLPADGARRRVEWRRSRRGDRGRSPRGEWSTLTVWAARAAWLAVAVVGGDAVGEALADHSRAVQLTGTVGAWTGWTAGALALAVAGVVTLTAVRAIVPAAIVVAGISAVAGAGGGAFLAIAVPSVVAAVFVGSAETGRRYVQADAYGDEHRFPLRPPFGYLAATVVTWAVWTAAVITAPLAIAARGLVIGALAAIVAAAATWLFPRRWHQLSRRWFVIVPAGLVVHDPVVLADTLMLPRRVVTSVRPVTSRTGALDLTGPTPGLALEVTLDAAATAVLAPRPDMPRGRSVHMTALRVAPSRPGAALRAQPAMPPPSTKRSEQS